MNKSMNSKSDLVFCPYCWKEAKLVTGKTIYPHRTDLYKKHFYLCNDCDAYVGCHPNTTKPLGRLADAELRAAKVKAHAAIDPYWKSGRLHRAQVYKQLAIDLAIPPAACHIGMFDVAMCKAVVDAASKWK